MPSPKSQTISIDSLNPWHDGLTTNADERRCRAGEDVLEHLDHSERWVADTFRILDAPGFCLTVEVDVGATRDVIERARERGERFTWTLAFVRAAALALKRHPDLHVLQCGNERLRPSTVDISLSIAGQAAASPLLVFFDAGNKRLPELARELVQRAPEVRLRDDVELAFLRKWGWLVPIAPVRRFLLRMLASRLSVRRRRVGTFQVTVVPQVDEVFPFTFATTGILAAGRVREKVVPHEGGACIRPVVKLVCTADHKVWDGQRAGRFLAEVERILKHGELAADLTNESQAPEAPRTTPPALEVPRTEDDHHGP